MISLSPVKLAFVSSIFLLDDSSAFSSASFGLNKLHRGGRSVSCAGQLLSVTNNIESKYYQLEELEDKEDTTTEIFLTKGRTIDVGESNGPIPVASSGEWKINDDGCFEMTIRRTFDAGKKESLSTDMGEFTFEVERFFVGAIEAVGENIAVSGKVVCPDKLFGDMDVGFFNMIDTTDVRLDLFGDDKEKKGDVATS